MGAAAARGREEGVAVSLRGVGDAQAPGARRPAHQGRGVGAGLRVAGEVRRAVAGDQGARRPRTQVVPARVGVGVEVGDIDAVVVRDDGPDRVPSSTAASQPLQSVTPGNDVSCPAVDDVQGATGGMVRVEGHHRRAVGRDRGASEAVTRRGAPARRTLTRGQVDGGQAVAVLTAGGGVDQRVGAQCPGAADDGRGVRAAVEDALVPGRQIDQGGPVGSLRQPVLADDEGVVGVEEGVGDA